MHSIYTKQFGFTYEVKLATRPELSIGEDSVWEDAERQLRKALDDSNIPYSIKEGDGAFYGPKIDIEIKDALARSI